MAKKVEFDLQAAHRHFSAECFNRAWDYIDKPTRTTEEDDMMLRLCLASLWHWTQREDCTATNLSVGYWQAARVYTLLGETVQARHYGMLSLQSAKIEGVAPFYLGYAYEALARAEHQAGDQMAMDKYLSLARQVAEGLPDQEAKEQLLNDLVSIH